MVSKVGKHQSILWYPTILCAWFESIAVAQSGKLTYKCISPISSKILALWSLNIPLDLLLNYLHSNLFYIIKCDIRVPMKIGLKSFYLKRCLRTKRLSNGIDSLGKVNQMTFGGHSPLQINVNGQGGQNSPLLLKPGIHCTNFGGSRRKIAIVNQSSGFLWSWLFIGGHMSYIERFKEGDFFWSTKFRMINAQCVCC